MSAMDDAAIMRELGGGRGGTQRRHDGERLFLV